MNEWQTIAWFVGISSVFFTAIWIIIQDVKKGVHARVKQCEHAIDGIISVCNKKKDDFITTKGFDRFENHLTTRFDGLDKNITGLTKRIDDLVLTVINGKTT